MEQDENKPTEKAPVAKNKLLDNKVVLFGIIIVMQLVMAIVLVEFVVTPKLKAVADDSPEIVQEEVLEGTLVPVMLCRCRRQRQQPE